MGGSHDLELSALLFQRSGAFEKLYRQAAAHEPPFMEEQEGQTGSGGHPSRYDMSGKRHLLISTCGFYTAKNNYDSVTKLFDHVCGAGQYESIFCGQGELFRVPELKARTDEYLECVRQAGARIRTETGDFRRHEGKAERTVISERCI